MDLYSIELKVTLTKEQHSAVMRELSSLKNGSEHEYEVAITPQKLLGMAFAYSMTFKTNNPDYATLVMAVLKKN